MRYNFGWTFYKIKKMSTDLFHRKNLRKKFSTSYEEKIKFKITIKRYNYLIFQLHKEAIKRKMSNNHKIYES